MIFTFADKVTEDIYHGIDSKSARRIPRLLWKTAFRKLDMINAAHQLRDLRIPPANKLEELKGNLSGFYSIRINDQYRIVFRWTNGNAYEVMITDYH
ncbi:MAG: type II toxin-antitoxin system RelE/ParE family toxin [Ignavibacteriales bacterium]|nr:type II toxin-antitoxin system RelE/ParE family toxin [Ignavibacteriales bacterium]